MWTIVFTQTANGNKCGLQQTRQHNKNCYSKERIIASNQSSKQKSITSHEHESFLKPDWTALNYREAFTTLGMSAENIQFHS